MLPRCALGSLGSLRRALLSSIPRQWVGTSPSAPGACFYLDMYLHAAMVNLVLFFYYWLGKSLTFHSFATRATPARPLYNGLPVTARVTASLPGLSRPKAAGQRSEGTNTPKASAAACQAYRDLGTRNHLFKLFKVLTAAVRLGRAKLVWLRRKRQLCGSESISTSTAAAS